MSTQASTFLTPEQYLEIERKAEYKSEYYNGEMFALAGAGLAHTQLVARVVTRLSNQLNSGPCQAVSNDLRVRAGASGLFTYPDVVVFCGEPQLLDENLDALLNPRVIVEVLSPATEAFDRGRKFEHYQRIESLREYLLVASDRMHVDLFTKRANGEWVLTSADGGEGVIEMRSIDCRLVLSTIYERIQLVPKNLRGR